MALRGLGRGRLRQESRVRPVGQPRRLLRPGAVQRIFVPLFLLAVTVFALGPFVFMLLISFQNIFFVSGNPLSWIPKQPTLDPYLQVLKTPNFLRWVFNSLFVSAAVTIAALFIHSLAGYVFARKQFPAKNLLFLLVLAGIMVPKGVVVIPTFLLARTLGLLNTYYGLILPPLALPIGVFLMRQFFMTLPSELEDAARIDGCSEFAVFWRVFLPLAKPGLAVLGIYTFMEQWREFLWPLIVITDDAMKTLPVGLSIFNTEFRTNYGVQMAGVLLSLLPVGVVYVFAQRFFVRGMTFGAIKG